MNLLSRFRRGDVRLDRAAAFSDGVFAIIVTLLVLELRVSLPDHADTPDALLTALGALAPKLGAWAVSFLVVCKFWLAHNHTLSLSPRADVGLLWLNSALLMGVSLIPFVATLMGEHPLNPLAVALFGWCVALTTLLFCLLHGYIQRQIPARDEDCPLLFGPAWYTVAAALAWLHPHIAIALYGLVPLALALPRRPRRCPPTATSPSPSSSAFPFRS